MNIYPIYINLSNLWDDKGAYKWPDKTKRLYELIGDNANIPVNTSGDNWKNVFKEFESIMGRFKFYPRHSGGFNSDWNWGLDDVKCPEAVTILIDLYIKDVKQYIEQTINRYHTTDFIPNTKITVIKDIADLKAGDSFLAYIDDEGLVLESDVFWGINNDFRFNIELDGSLYYLGTCIDNDYYKVEIL